MSKYAAVNVKFGADISSFSTAMQNAAREMKKAGDQLQNVGRSMTMNLTAPIVALGAAALYSFGQIDALKRGLISFAGSAQLAEDEFNKLREVAKLPGIGLEEAVKGSINLQAIGMGADEARKAMMAFGNAIATVGGGKENFDLAIRGFSQLTNASRPLQQDLYQIANQLPQVNKLMIEAFGTNRAEDLARMGISGKQLAEFLVDKLGELPKVSGGIKNSFENMSDSVKISLASIGETIEKKFNISGIIDGLASTLSGLAEGFKNLSAPMQSIILGAVTLLAAIGPLSFGIGTIIKILPTLAAGFAVFSNAVPYLKVIALAATAAAFAYEFWGKKIKEAKTETDGVTESISKEKAEIQTLFERLKLTNGVSGERSRLITEINAKYGTTLKNLSDETAFQNQLAKAQGEVIAKMKEKIILAAATKDLEASIKKQIELEDQLSKNVVATAKAKADMNDGSTMGEAVNIQQNKLVAEGLALSMAITKEIQKQQQLLNKGAKINLDTPKGGGTTPVGTLNLAEPIKEATAEAAKEIEYGYEYMDTTTKAGLENLDHTFSESVDVVPSRIDEMRLKTNAKLEQWANDAKELTAELNSILSQGVENAIIDLASAFGENLVDNDPFKDLGNVLFNSLGKMMKMMGSAMIAWGINLAIFEANISNPFVAIAAGAALVAAGAAISKISSEGMKGSGATSGGGYGGSSGSSGSSGNLTLTTRVDGRDLVFAGDNTTRVQRR